MYTITRMRNGTFYCEGRVQDGTERWSKPTLKKAVQSMISFARVMNGTYIREEDIIVLDEPEPPPPDPVSVADRQLIAQIRSGAKVALLREDKRIKYRITQEDCDLIVKIREGILEVKGK